MEKWQPIETADYGEPFLAARRLDSGEWLVRLARLERDVLTIPGDWRFPATHWMSLSAPPDSEGE